MPRRHLTKLGLAPLTMPPPSSVCEDGALHPRPMLRRAEWMMLDGAWEFAIDADAEWEVPEQVVFDSTIEVPFAPETARSGIGDGGFYKACWYRRVFTIAARVGAEECVLLHFGAVDYDATVWLDGRLVARHAGGYTPFEIDLTRALAGATDGHEHELVVRAEDDPSDLAKPRGKQDWQLHAHSIWYPRTTGIWQSVWIERLSCARIADLHWTPNMAQWEIAMDAEVVAPPGQRLWLALRLMAKNVLLAEDRYSVVAGEVHRRIALSDPGIDDFRNELLWSPSTPTLIDAELELLDAQGRTVDAVRSYTALRSFEADGDRFVLNGRPYPLRMVLDQGYWPESGLTAPDDGALRRDVELTKAMGFNGARKHQKVEDPRYLYWADRLGLLVWVEMPSAYRFTRTTVERVIREWTDVIHRDMSHPCIVAWVPFNESWGVPNLPQSTAERHYVETVYHLTKTLDPTRPVVGNDGWESVATDILGIHDYDDEPARIAARYATPELLPKILKRERPGGRALVIANGVRPDVPVVLSEFGGIAVAAEAVAGASGDVASDVASWGYSVAPSSSELEGRYAELLTAVRSLELLAGFCYTQLTDTYQEANGLLHADRTPKFPIAEIAAATTGKRPKRSAAEHPAEPPASVAELALSGRGGAPR